jgi:hypothetical protein
LAETGLAGELAETGLAGELAETGLAGELAETGLAGELAETGLAGELAETGLPALFDSVETTGGAGEVATDAADARLVEVVGTTTGADGRPTLAWFSSRITSVGVNAGSLGAASTKPPMVTPVSAPAAAAIFQFSFLSVFISCSPCSVCRRGHRCCVGTHHANRALGDDEADLRLLSSPA